MNLFGRKKEQNAPKSKKKIGQEINGPIGKEQIQQAIQILQKYKEGKNNLEKRIVDNEEWYKLRHWECMRKKKTGGEVEPASAWLFNSIANKHADAMDNSPAPNVLPREDGDKEEAKRLSSIIPVILQQNDFEKVYDEVWTYKLKSGTGVYGVFWDAKKLNGLGDISIKKIDLLNLFWEPGISDIQDSRNLFNVELVSNEALRERYPDIQEFLSTPTLEITKYIFDDAIDTSDKSVVVDWYYKKTSDDGRTVLHYCKFVNNYIIFATENDPDFAKRGLYDHGRYPFEFDPLFRTEGTPAGFGYIDVGKSAQEYIDRGNQAIMENLLSNAQPRYFINSSGAVNEEEFADLSKHIVHVDGALGQDSVLPIQGKPLNAIYVSIINNKIEELKETTGNRDVSTGGSTSGVTAASAIAAMQEAGGKLSRDNNKAAYRVFRQICLDIIELIRQFYDLPRCFRIMGEAGAAEFIRYSNEKLKAQSQGMDFGVDMGDRIPLFDIEVTAERQSPYNKLANNEFAMELYGRGFFNPAVADQAMACAEMMDFDKKDYVLQRISQNGLMYQQLIQMQEQLMHLGAIVDSMKGNNEITSALMQQFGSHTPDQFFSGQEGEEKNGEIAAGESSVTQKARKQASETATPT